MRISQLMKKKSIPGKRDLELSPCALTRHGWESVGMKFNGSNEQVILDWIRKSLPCDCHPFVIEMLNGNIYFTWLRNNRRDCLSPGEYFVIQTDGPHTIFSLMSENIFTKQFIVEDE